MKNTCCVPNCKSNRRNDKLHRISKTEIGLKWVAKINCPKLKKLSSEELTKQFVCHKHFEKRFKTCKLRLHSIAYPTLFTNEEIATGIPASADADSENLNVLHDQTEVKKCRHEDHSYSKQQPLKELQQAQDYNAQSSSELLKTTDQIIENQLQDLAEASTPPPVCDEWLPRPDVCRCCLTRTGSHNLMATCSDEDGSQVPLDIIKDCLGISLSNILECSPSRLVCDKCAESLHTVHLFKQQVIAAEKAFIEYYGKGTDNNVNLSMVKTEENIYLDEHTPDYHGMDVTDHDEDWQEDDAFATLQWKKPVKAVSDRKKMRLTCETVLKHTTACPFRHQKSWFRCFYCTIDFIEFDELREHTLQNHRQDDVAILKTYPKMLQIDITVLECKLCNVNLIDVKDMVEHFTEAHNMTIYKECIVDYKLNIKPFTCHLCNKQYHVFRTLTVHLNEHYKNCICDVCGKSYLNRKRLTVHKRTHEIGNFPCNECGKVLKTKSSQANHIEKHTKRVLKCHLCLKTMKHYNDRIKHMSEEHNVTNNFKCLLCGRDFKVKHYLATHMRQTHGHKNKKCPECGMAFVTNHGLKKHMLKHTGVKAFTCNVCNKSYTRGYTLREHMRGHETEAKFAGS